MTQTMGRPTAPEEPPAHQSERERGWRDRIALLTTVIATSAIVLATVLVAVALNDRDDAAPADTPVAPTTRTSAPSSTASTAPTGTPVTELAVWPWASSPTRYDDAFAAASGFATDFLGFRDPTVGTFRLYSAGSGTVGIRPTDNGPLTTVTVRQRPLDRSWWVLGASTDDLVLGLPTAGATVSSPLRIEGVSTAYEATFTAQLREDGARSPLASQPVMGGANGEMGPFADRIRYDRTDSTRGALVLAIDSMEDESTWAATVVRVRFDRGSGATPVRCDRATPERPSVEPDEMVVAVHFTCGDVDDEAVPVYRIAPSSPGVLRAALTALLAGPTEAERRAGYQSWFTPATAGMLGSVTVDGGRAVVDFGDLRPVIPNASASAGSRMLLSQLDATVFQFTSVSSVIYRIDGDCETFSDWLQYGGCDPRTR